MTNKTKTTIMKKALLSILLLVAAIAAVAQNSTLQLAGRLIDGEKRAIPFATVLLSPSGEEFRPDGNNHHYTLSDNEGCFRLQAVAGNYTLALSSIGYESQNMEITLTADTNLGDITLAEKAELIEDVVITGGLITREADRFVMNNLSESILSKGRTTYEMLKLAPAVYADESGSISINGRSGAKVLINEREVRMTGEQLMNYLKSIPAENLQKIEILPESGADYDADSVSGIIKITLRKQRDSGTSGSISFGSNISTIVPAYYIGPSGNINHKSGKWNLYGNLSLSQSQQQTNDIAIQEDTHYDNGAKISSKTYMNTDDHLTGGGMVGAIYDIDEKSSIGVEYNIWRQPDYVNTTSGTLLYTLGDYTEHHESIFAKTSGSLNQSATANYIRTLDERGSTFKIIADWANNRQSGTNLNTDTSYDIIGGLTGEPTDSLYRNRSNVENGYYTLSAAVEKKISDYTTISYGAKYTLTDTYSTTDYAYKRGEEWVKLEEYNQLTDYNEHIGALYGIYSTRFLSGASISAGLRAEYTSIPQLSERYVSLFPHLNASTPLNPKQTVIISAAYKRAIARPSFWSMNPVRTQLSEFSYQVGNPDLKPVFANALSLTGIFFYRYSLSFGATFQEDSINQIAVVDDADPTGRTLKYIHVNLHNLYQYYAQLSIPAQITPWWSINANLIGVVLDQRIESNQTKERNLMAQGYMSNTFSLPRGWNIDLSGQFTTDAKVGNLTQRGSGNISLSVKKLCFDDRLVLSVGCSNILPTSNQKVYASGEGFSKTYYAPNLWMRAVQVSIRYNFQSGKMFRARSVESGAADEKSRI